jgi:membrane fusion protein (multidrug efflux system)
LLAVLAACAPHPQPKMPAPGVSVLTLKAQSVELGADLPGRTSPYETSDVRPQVNGIIKARLFKEGANVRAGQILYQIDPAPYRATYDQAVAQLANAKAAVVTARLKAERYADLVKINAVSHQDADDAQAAYGEAAATVQQQAAAVETARINLAYTRVTAPISGRIGTSAFTVGALVTNGQTSALNTIQRLDPIYVDVTQSAAELVALRRDMARGGVSAPTAAVRLDLDGAPYPIEGRLQFQDVTVDQTTGSVTLRAIFPNPKGVLLPGMYVRAHLVEGIDTSGILAPQEAVTRDEKGQATALVAGPDGRAEARVLQVGEVVGHQWRVVSGLKAGDRLIVEGAANAKPGQPVRVLSAKTQTPAS